MAHEVPDGSQLPKAVTLVSEESYRGMFRSRFYIKDGEEEEVLQLEYPIETARYIESKGYTGTVQTSDGQTYHFEPGVRTDLFPQTVIALYFDEGSAQ